MAWLRSSGSKTSTALAGVWVAFTLVAMPVAAGAGGYTETDLASDLPDRAPHMDSSLVNPWGLVSGPTTPWWTSDNGTGMSTLLKADGSEFAAPFNPVNIPMTDCAGAGTPTGVVFDGTSSFTFNDCDGVARHGRFMFATEDGSIVAWDAPMKTAVTVVDPSSAAVFKGLAIGSNDQGTFLYATNFRAGSVVVDKPLRLGIDRQRLPDRDLRLVGLDVVGDHVVLEAVEGVGRVLVVAEGPDLVHRLEAAQAIADVAVISRGKYPYANSPEIADAASTRIASATSNR